jgi:hypothetical protein
MKEIKIIENKLYVGVDDYKKLDKSILKSNNLLKIKRLYDIFNKKYNIDKNTFYQGVSIYENYVYIITNIKNNKKYIGETTNIVSRIYTYINISTNNKELKNDFIKYGLVNFDIEFIPSNNRKELEKKYILEYNDNCYNILFTTKNIISSRRQYKIGQFNFKSKKEIKEFCRKTLDSYVSGTYINLDNKIGDFAKNMIKLHPSYDEFIDYSKEVKLSVIKDDEGDSKGIGKWNIFCFEYIDRRNKKQKWGFSTNKIIDNL